MFFIFTFLFGILFRIFMDSLGVEFLSKNSIIANIFMFVAFLAGMFFNNPTATKEKSRSSFNED